MRTGLEPVTSCVTGRHSNQAELTHLFAIASAKVVSFLETQNFFALFLSIDAFFYVDYFQKIFFDFRRV